MRFSITRAITLFIIVVFTLLSSEIKASHITGADFSYQCLGNDSFLITLNIFRDCEGIAPSATMPVTIENSCGTSQSFNVSLISSGQQEVSPVCELLQFNTTCKGGTIDGMEVWIYTAVIALDPSCGGRATVAMTGGDSNYVYHWPMQLDSASIGDLCAGHYPLVVTDGNGCVLNDSTVLIDSSGLYLSGVVNQISCPSQCDGNITVTPYGGVAPYTYSWDNGNSTTTRSNLCPGEYSEITGFMQTC